MMRVPAALAHQPAMIVRRLFLFRLPKTGELHKENQNEEHTEDRFPHAVNDGLVMPDQCNHRAHERNRAKNLSHIQIRAVLFL